MDIPFLINKKLEDAQAQQLLDLDSKENPILFAIIGDLDEKASFQKTALLATASYFFTYSFETGKVSEPTLFDEMEGIRTKRMYGNGLIRAKMKDGSRKDVFRFNFAIASLCDAAVGFAGERTAGVDIASSMEGMNANFQKMLSICPRCGRTLAAPGVPCVQCMGKGKLVKKFGKYLVPELWNLILSVFLSIAHTALSLVPPLLTAMLVDDILAKGLELKADERLHKLIIVCLGLVGIHFVQHFLGAFRGYRLRVSGDRIISALRCEVYEKAQRLPMRFYDKTSTGSVINRINGDTSNLQSFMLRITQEVVVQFFTLIGIVVIMLVLNWKLTLFSLIPIPIIVIGSRIFRKKIEPFYRRIWIRGTAISSTLTDTLPGIRVIKSFTNEENACERFNGTVEEWRKTDTQAGKILSVFPAIIGTLVSLGGTLIWLLGGNMVIAGLNVPEGATAANAISVGLLVSFISYASMFYNPVNFFANLADSTQSALTSAERIMDILDAEPEHDFGKGNTKVDMGGQIVFKNVSFSYDRSKKVLSNINLTIDPGDIVGIVGTTGSGKSTLVSLLLRYYDHYDGEITVGGVNIRDIDMKYYRSNIGYVQQEPMMFHDTIYNNISYGDASFTKDEIIHAADIANAHKFIVRQPDGYDCVLGERGTGLSGGERQRVSIARAVLRNPKMLVFDEATASVDSETEHLIQEAIENLISGRTTIMIAHRLSTLSKANKIVVVDNGEIIECGTPQELMALQGKYYKLVQIQTMSDQVAKSKREEHFD